MDPLRAVVDEEGEGVRLDAFLARRGLAASAAAARRAIAGRRVTVDGRPAKKGQRLSRGQEVVVAPVEEVRARAAPELPLVVLYADEDLIAVDKPAQVASHRLTADEPPTAADALVARYPECALASPDPREGGLAHRLDRGTSGVLVAARHRRAWDDLRRALSAPGCEKRYLAETRGRPQAPPPGEDPFAAPGGAPDSVIVTADIGRRGRRGARVTLGRGRGPLPARTEIRVVEPRGETSLVEARLERGRAHQVRAHLAYVGAPVVGDDLYGEAQQPGDLRLHASALAFVHPRTGQRLLIEAPPPAWARPHKH